MLNRAWIASKIPHQGSMCLLDEVLAWNEQRIVCSAVSHTSPENPLRLAGRLGSANGVEYAAQAMAVHGALLAPATAAPAAAAETGSAASGGSGGSTPCGGSCACH